MKDMSKCKTLKEIANNGLIPKIIEEIMLEIKKNNLIYQNEKQFQFDLAWRINKQIDENSGIKVMLEYFSMVDNNIEDKSRLKKVFTDILLLDEDKNFIPVELKYKKAGMKTNINGMGEVEIGHDGAEDLGRFAYLWDIHRIEQLSNKEIKGCDKVTIDSKLNEFVCGYAIMITDADSYWLDKKQNCAQEMTLNQEIDKIKWHAEKDGEPSSLVNEQGRNHSKYFKVLIDNPYAGEGSVSVDKKYMPLSRKYNFKVENEKEIDVNFKTFKTDFTEIITIENYEDSTKKRKTIKAFIAKI